MTSTIVDIQLNQEFIYIYLITLVYLFTYSNMEIEPAQNVHFPFVCYLIAKN